ncbi:uncharacterized, partial [Tachysurus ichikawai]
VKLTAPVCVVTVAGHNDISSCDYDVAAPLRLLPICRRSDVVYITPHLQISRVEAGQKMQTGSPDSALMFVLQT